MKAVLLMLVAVLCGGVSMGIIWTSDLPHPISFFAGIFAGLSFCFEVISLNEFRKQNDTP